MLNGWIPISLKDSPFSSSTGAAAELRSTNLLERLNREIKRRTRVSTLFPNEESHSTGKRNLMEQSEEWETGIVILTLRIAVIDQFTEKLLLIGLILIFELNLKSEISALLSFPLTLSITYITSLSTRNEETP